MVIRIGHKSPSKQHACERMNIMKKIVTSPYNTEILGIKSRVYSQNMTYGRSYVLWNGKYINQFVENQQYYLSNVDSIKAFCAQDLHPMQHRSFALM